MSLIFMYIHMYIYIYIYINIRLSNVVMTLESVLDIFNNRV